LGHAWFVDSVKEAATAKDALSDINFMDLKKNAVIEKADYSGKAEGGSKGMTLQSRVFSLDSAAGISQTYYSNDSIAYKSNNANAGLAVFSEIYYNEKNGAWKAFVDGKEAQALRVNYILRGVEVPAGNHEIVWVYQPSDRSTMLTIEVASSALILLLVAGSLLQLGMKKEEEAA
jgi:hypothetical protein